MATSRGSVEIACSPEEAFRYSTDISVRPAWQQPVDEISVETPGPTGVGTRVREVRKVQGRAQTFPWVFTDFRPPQTWSFRTLAGPVRPRGTMTFTRLDGGRRTRAVFEMEFEGHGLGWLLVPLARRGAPSQIEGDLAGLKRRLETRSVADGPE